MNEEKPPLVVEIPRRIPNEGLIAGLEKLLEYAKAGEIRSAIVVSSWYDGSVNSWYSFNPSDPLRTLTGEMFFVMTQVASEFGDPLTKRP